MRQVKNLAAVFLCLFLLGKIRAQDKEPERVPVYTTAYTLPAVDSILTLLNKVSTYYQATSKQKVILSSTGETYSDFSTLNKDVIVSPGFSSEWSYTHGVVLSAFEYITFVTGDTSFFSRNKRFYDFVCTHLPYFKKNAHKYGVEAGGWPSIIGMHSLDDCGSIGAALIKTYLKVKDKRYLELIDITNDFISNKQFRLEDGTLARHRPQYKSLWADDIYMSVPFLANMGVLTGEKRYFDDAVKQIVQMAKRLYVPEKELFDHGWNVNSGEYDPRFFWGRANGWTMMSMVELLGVLPEEHPGRKEVLHLYRSMVRSVASLQDGSGFWHNMLDKNTTFPETSCTAMFTFAIAKGINEGWVSHVFGPVALTGWNALQTSIRPDGAVDGTCEATTFAHDNTYYFNRGKSIYATHGYGPVLYAGAEIVRLLRNQQFRITVPKNNSINSTFHFLLRSEWTQQASF